MDSTLIKRNEQNETKFWKILSTTAEGHKICPSDIVPKLYLASDGVCDAFCNP